MSGVVVFVKHIMVFIVAMMLSAVMLYACHYPRIYKADQTARGLIERMAQLLSEVRDFDVVRESSGEFRRGALLYYNRVENTAFVQWCERVMDRNRSACNMDPEKKARIACDAVYGDGTYERTHVDKTETDSAYCFAISISGGTNCVIQVMKDDGKVYMDTSAKGIKEL